MATPSAVLSNHDRELLAACGELRDAIYGAELLELVDAYRRFEDAVLSQFEAEEQLLLSAYTERFPATTRQLLQEHAALRRLLRHVAIDVELHVVRVEQLDTILDRLRSHAAFEEVTLYRWADQRLDVEATTELVARLGKPPGPHVEPEHPMPISRLEHTGFRR